MQDRAINFFSFRVQKEKARQSASLCYHLVKNTCFF
jgi:hypothetical protein